MRIRPASLGLVAGAIGVALLLLYLHRFEESAVGGRKVSLLIANALIERGKPISSDLLGIRDVPQAYVDDRAIRASEQSKVLGLHATSNVPVQQTLTWSDLIAETDDQRALSSLVQPGNRGMTVRAQMPDVLPLIRPGDFVDVILVTADSKDASVLLQRVLVLAAGLETSSDRASDRHASTARATNLTLSVSLPESQLLALAMEKGRLSIAVRNPDDQRVTEAPPDLSPSALTDPARRPPSQNSGRRAGLGPQRLEPERRP